MADNEFQGNYFAIMPIWIKPPEEGVGPYCVVGYFSNHKEAFHATEKAKAGNTQTQEFRSRSEGAAHAVKLIDEFSMGDGTNPIAIVHLDSERNVVVKGGNGRWETTGEKLGRL